MQILKEGFLLQNIKLISLLQNVPWLTVVYKLSKETIPGFLDIIASITGRYYNNVVTVKDLKLGNLSSDSSPAKY